MRPLTDREAEVLALVAAGKTDKQVAAVLRMAENTVGVHITRIAEKLAVPRDGNTRVLITRAWLVRERVIGAAA